MTLFMMITQKHQDFLPVNSNRKKKDSILEKLLLGTTNWPHKGSEPLNEYASWKYANYLQNRNL